MCSHQPLSLDEHHFLIAQRLHEGPDAVLGVVLSLLDDVLLPSGLLDSVYAMFGA
jgi:hypothetical protein